MEAGPEFSTDSQALELAESDFGGIVVSRPSVVARPRSVEGVVRCLEFARGRGLSVVARGQGHSTRGQASVSGGLVVDLTELDDVRVVAGEGLVQAGARWSSVLKQTLCSDLMPPTLTDYLGLSVGGTLSVGGVGGQSFRFGLQTDQVHALTVVTGAGGVITCSPDDDQELFDACRAGLGQCGIIVGARLALVKAPPTVRIHKFRYRELDPWLDDQSLLAEDGRFDYLLGSIVPGVTGWCYLLEATTYLSASKHPAATDVADLGFDRGMGVESYTMGFAAYANRLEVMERGMKAQGTWQSRHPWMDLFVPQSAIHRVVDRALSTFMPEQLVDSHTLTYPLRADVCQTPLVPVPSGEASFLFGLGPNVPTDDLSGLEAFERGCQSLFEFSADLGGSVYPIGYPVGTPVMNGSRWRRHFGRGRLADAKRRYDPDGRLRSVMEI